jgi:hypothetical protein
MSSICEQTIVILEQELLRLGKELKLPDASELVEKEIEEAENEISALFALRNSLTEVQPIKKGIILPEETEISIFKSFIDCGSENTFYHYTKEKCATAILGSRTLWLSAASNRSGTYELPYLNVDNYMRLKKQDDNHNAKEALKKRFIFSMSFRTNNPFHWEDYGDKGKGICLEFRYKPENQTDENLILGRVSYNKEIPNFINTVNCRLAKELGVIIYWYQLWLYRSFIKLSDFEPEDEVRLLYDAHNGNKESKTENGKKYCEFAFDELPLEFVKAYSGPFAPKN